MHVDIPSHDATERVAAVLKALGHPVRLAIVRRLALGEASVGQLLTEMPMDQPLISQHLQVLRRSGVARCRRDGTRMVYALTDPMYARLTVEAEQAISSDLVTTVS